MTASSSIAEPSSPAAPTTPIEAVRQALTSRQAKEFACGWGAGCVETCVLYPVVKLIFRQQLHGVLLRTAFTTVLGEGPRLLYRGLLPPLIQRATARMVMFGMIDSYRSAFGCKNTGPMSSLSVCHAAAAVLAGATEAILCPLERVNVLLQDPAYHTHFRNTKEAFKVVRSYGFYELYRGLIIIIVRNALSNTIFFGLRDPLKAFVLNSMQPTAPQQGLAEMRSEATDTDSSQIHQDNQDSSCITDSTPSSSSAHSHFLNVLADFSSGALLGASINTLFFPLNVVKQRMQSQLGTAFDSPWRVAAMLWRERNRSARELYRGVQLNFTRSLLTWGITNSVYEALRRLVM